LLTAAAGGDEKAWRAIVDLYARRVYALARSRLWGTAGTGSTLQRVRASDRNRDGWIQGNDTAEEVTQSVFVTIAGKLRTGEYTEQGRFESWLFRVAMNRVRDEIRRLRRHAAPTDPEMLGALADGRSPASTSERGGESVIALRHAMEQLNDHDREVVELRHHAGLSFKQIADMLDEPLGTLLARHHRALRKLKDILTADAPSAMLKGDGT
jgi:RNA polymerase sigma-70 factor (ECF subfamily)